MSNKDDIHGSKKVWDDAWRKVADKNRKHYKHGRAKTQKHFFGQMNGEFMETIFTNLKTTTWLECACGRADTSLYFVKEKGYKAIMLDTSEAALRIAKSNFKEEGVSGIFVRGDVESIPFKDNVFDIVTNFGLLEHFENIEPPIREMVRIVRPGGIFLAGILPERFSVQTLVDIPKKMLYYVPKTLIGNALRLQFWRGIRNVNSLFSPPPYYENSFSTEEYQKALENTRLTNVEIVGINPFPTIENLPPVVEKTLVRLLEKTIAIRRLLFRRHPWISSLSWCRVWLAFGTKRK